jgi:hypothetical protein
MPFLFFVFCFCVGVGVLVGVVFGLCFLVCLVVGLCFLLCLVVGGGVLFHFYVVFWGCGVGGGGEVAGRLTSTLYLFNE